MATTLSEVVNASPQGMGLSVKFFKTKKMTSHRAADTSASGKI